MTFEKVASMLAEYKGIEIAEVREESTFADLKLDSLDVAELVMNMEDEFGVTLELDENVKNVADLVKLIDEATEK